jgi:hypothetical protein
MTAGRRIAVYLRKMSEAPDDFKKKIAPLIDEACENDVRKLARNGIFADMPVRWLRERPAAVSQSPVAIRPRFEFHPETCAWVRALK